MPQNPGLDPLRAVGSVREWQTARKAILRRWRAILGEPGMKAPDARLEILEEETLPRVIRQRVRYRTEPDVWSEAYLLLPRERKGRAAGVVVFHSTVDYNICQPAGLDGAEDLHIGLRLAERGFVALCPRCFIYEYHGKKFAEAVTALKEAHPAWTGMGKMLWDGQRALDVLARHPAVDSKRLGAIGHSLGAKETLYLAAFDSRVKAAVFSEGGIGLSFSNWEAPWYLGDQIRSPGFRGDHHELLALCAPRAFLLIGGGSADGKQSQPYIEAARSAFAAHRVGDRLKSFVHGAGHAFPASAQSAAYAWLARYLKASR